MQSISFQTPPSKEQTIIQQALAIAEKWGEYIPGRSFRVFVELPDDLTIEVEFAETTVLVRKAGTGAILFQAHEPHFSTQFTVLAYVVGPWTEILEVEFKKITPRDEGH